MSKKLFVVIAVLAVGAVFLAACSPAAPVVEVKEAAPAEEVAPAEEEAEKEVEEEMALSGQLQLAGSTTVQPLAEVLAESFMDINADVSIDVQGGGSSVGVTAAGEGTVDIGMSSRAIKDSEFEVFPDLQVFTIAYDGIAVVVNSGVELPTLSIDEVRAIFSGAITNFSDVGGTDAPITIVSREEGSGTRAAFEDLVMKYKDNAGEKVIDLITEAALLQQSNGQVRTIIAETPNTIGYLSFGFLDDSVTGVPIDDVAPSIDNVLNGSYPIFRPLNMETGGEPSDLAKTFLDFILSADGQAIVAEDYIPVE